jgi:hypothetical protein
MLQDVLYEQPPKIKKKSSGEAENFQQRKMSGRKGKFLIHILHSPKILSQTRQNVFIYHVSELLCLFSRG